MCQALSASVAEFVTYPIALVRTREQAHLASPNVVFRYKGLFSTLNNLYRLEGLKALYRGVWSSALMASFSWGAVRYLYERLGCFTFSSKEFTDCMIRSIISSFITTSIVHPFWIARLSLQLESIQAKRAGWFISGNTAKWIYHTFSRHGAMGLFKGYSASFTSIPQITIQMTLYESLKGRKTPEGNSTLSFLNPYLPIIYGSLSRLCGSLCTYPVMVSRAQMQCQLSPYFQQGIIKNIVHTYKMQSISGLYVGFKCQIMRSLLYGLIFYTSYETLTKLALKRNALLKT